MSVCAFTRLVNKSVIDKNIAFCIEGQFAANGQGLLQGWNSLLVRPEPLLNKDIKVQVNKQKPSYVCPAQMKHNSDNMPNCSNVLPALQQTQCYRQLVCHLTAIILWSMISKKSKDKGFVAPDSFSLMNC